QGACDAQTFINGRPRRWRRLPIPTLATQQRQENDDRKRNAEHPEQNSTSHDLSSSPETLYQRVRWLASNFSSRWRPPIPAPHQAAAAPRTIVAAVRKARRIPAFRAVSVAARNFSAELFICSESASTRLSASACERPVRAATTRAR